MTNVADSEVFHTYLDDIKFQSVKESRRTSFSSIDYKIVSSNAQAIREIEKHQRLRTADHKRQENAYLQKLEKLNKMKVIKRTSPSTPSGDLTGRRHSAPTVFWAQLSQSPPDIRSSLTRANTNYPQRSANKSQTATTNLSFTSFTSLSDNGPTKELQSGYSPLNVQPRMMYRPSPEARRMSYDLQIETTKTAMQKLDMIVKSHKRRATIAEAVKSDFVSALETKNGLVDRSDSIEEEESAD